MIYYSGFLLAVPETQREAYKAQAARVWPIFEEFGCLRMVETWGVDVPDGKVTSFPMAVKKQEGEVVVFSWMEWPDRATADTAFRQMMADPRMKDMSDMPFDGMRMMWGGFEPLLDMKAKVPA